MNDHLKRYFDICISIILLILVFPLFLLVAAAIKIDSDGPVLFRQARLTKNGKIFMMLKFRSMVVNAESIGSGLFSYPNDPRVTKVGSFLRHFSLDELPQLFNVLRGDMSLVGPRSAVIDELGEYETLNARYRKRFTVLPGMTGYAQVKGRNGITWDEKVNYDNAYIDLFKRQGIWLDIKILFVTAVNVLSCKHICEEKVDGSISDIESAAAAKREIIKRAHAAENKKIIF